MTHSMYNPFHAFNPQELAFWASLNGTQVRDEPSFDTEARGAFAGSLLSTQALNRTIRSNASGLALTEAALEQTAPVALLNLCLGSNEAAIRQEAQEMAQRFGRHLAYLLITLLEGAPTRWPSALLQRYLHHWTTIRHVRLGGGNMRDALGHVVCDSARQTLAAYGHADLDLQVAANPHSLALLGAARSLGPETTTALVYDFGGTSIKRARASYPAGSLTTLEVFPPYPALLLKRPARRATFRARKLAMYMTGIIAEDWLAATAAGVEPSHEILAAIGSYIREGQLQSSTYESYGLLTLLPARPDVWLSETLSRRIGSQARVMLSHDGTTAARVYAGQPHTAVIMLGTWLGVGFAPEDASGLRPLAPDFTVSDAP